MSESIKPRAAAGWALAATGGALAGWWWQSRAREDALTERTRARLRAPGFRGERR